MSTCGICSVCSRSDAAAIDHDLAVSGMSVRKVAQRYGLGRSAVGRHKKEHLTARLKRAAEARAAGSDPGLLDQLRELNRAIRAVLKKAYDAGDHPAAVSAIGEARKQLELEGKLIGALSSGSGMTVNVSIPPAVAERMVSIAARRRPQALPGAIDASARPQTPEPAVAPPAVAEAER